MVFIFLHMVGGNMVYHLKVTWKELGLEKNELWKLLSSTWKKSQRGSRGFTWGTGGRGGEVVMKKLKGREANAAGSDRKKW